MSDDGGIGLVEVQKLLDQGVAVYEARRFHAACAAIAGYCANPSEVVMRADVEQRAMWSRKQADALLAELDKPKPKEGATP